MTARGEGLLSDRSQAYFARVRRSNYIASLHLAGFQVTPTDAERLLPSHEAIFSQLRSKCG
nr:YhfG family protein [Pseudomonas sp. AA-38]